MVDTSVMIEEYNNGASLNKLSRKYKITPYQIKKVLQANDIHIRSRNEQNKYSLQNQRQYTINDSYFSKQSSRMAYLLGFLAADGCVYKKRNLIKIGLSSIDRKFLEEIQIELKTNYKICDYETKDGFTVSELKFSSEQIKRDLAEYNIIPQKTYNFSFPKKLNSKYYLDFIRGYFDGDGSVSTAGQSLRWQICSYTKPILESIISIFQEYGISKVNIYKNRNLYYFQYSTNATKQIYNLLYYPNCWCLERKQKKYQQLLNMK